MARNKQHGEEYARYFLHSHAGHPPSDYPYHGQDSEPVAYGTVDDAQEMMRRTGFVHMNFLMFTWAGLYYHDGCYQLSDDPDQRAKEEAELKRRIVTRIRENNEWALGIVHEYDNLSFFCGVDPVLMDEKTLIEEIADKTSRGALGVKMVPDDSGARGDDRRLWPVYDYCQSNGLPILSQTSSNPAAAAYAGHFAPALKAFPKLKLICGHCGAGLEGEQRVAELTHAYENVCGDISSPIIRGVVLGDVTPDEAVIRLRNMGIERLMYGDNFHFAELSAVDVNGKSARKPQTTRVEALVQAFKSLPLRDEELEQIANKTFKELTGLKK
jgi:hypothetical protein